MNLKRILLKAVLHSRVYDWFMGHIVWRLRFSNYYSDVTGPEFYKVQENIKKGDILNSIDLKKFSTKVIGGEWSHSAVYLGGNLVAEMTHKGFTISTLYDFCKESDHVAIIRCNDFDEEYVNNIFIPNVFKFEGAIYDNRFGFGIEALYCSELPWQADTERRMKVNLADLAGLGQQYISPTGLYKMTNGSIIYSTKLERA